jgi:hypothetical protein
MSTYSEAALAKITFNGNTTTGYISVPGVKVGDMLVVAVNPPNPASPGIFPVIVDTADSVYQITDEDFSAIVFTALIVRIP